MLVDFLSVSPAPELRACRELCQACGTGAIHGPGTRKLSLSQGPGWYKADSGPSRRRPATARDGFSLIDA